MLKNRVIPCLLISQDGLVKTKKFKNPKYVGDPINAVKIFNEKEVDELIVLDIDASKFNHEPKYELITQLSSECFMPLTYGGGITNIDQAKTIFSLGVEKISLQTSTYKNINLISQISEKFGTQSVIASVDIKEDWLGRKKVFFSAKNKFLDIAWQDYLKMIVKSGAGEILINCIDHDGVMQGMNLKLIKEASELTSVPIIACGGVGSLKDIKEAIRAGASAVAAGSFFVFSGPYRAVLITYPTYKKLEEFLN